jgi:hemerythrin-like domain-containing protein
MNATDMLIAEHRVIEQVLHCLDRLIDQAEKTGRLADEHAAREIMDFLRVFADRCHHGKEERHLFPILETRGFAGACGPLAVMLREHELGRVYVAGMEAATDGAANGEPDALHWFVQHGQSYIRLLTEHIQKEERCLFPSANRAITEQDLQRLFAAFEHVEAEEMGEGTHQKYLEMANRLADQFDVPRLSLAGHDSSCGCHH